jgi:autotransporter-associated beta strand protein
MKTTQLGAATRASLLACAALCATSAVQAQNGTWIGLTSGSNWPTTTNWADNNADLTGDPPGSGASADLSTANLPAGTFTVNLTTPINLSQILFNDADTATAGTWTVASPVVTNTLTLSGSAILDTAVATTITSPILSTVGFTKNGAGTLTLGGASTVSGTVNLNAGQLTVTNGTTVGTGTINMANGTHLRLGNNYWGTATNSPIVLATGAQVTITTASTANAGYGGNFTGDATSLINIGAPGLLTQVSFSSTTQQFANMLGTVKIADGGSFRLSATNFTNGGQSTTFDTSNTGNITGRNANIFHLGALIGNGTLNGSVSQDNQTTTFSVGAKGIPCTFGGVIQNGNAIRRAALTKVGAEKLTLTGASTYTGATNINLGTLELGNGGTTGSLGLTTTTLAGGTFLIFNIGSTGVQTLPGVFAGTGTITKKGEGRTILSGVNTFTTNPVIEGGEIMINADSGLGNAANSVSFTTGSGKLVSDAAGLVTARAFSVGTGATGGFAAKDAADSIQVDGTISGDGSLEIGGSGVTTLTGTNTYLGNTTQVTGTLVANNTTGSATSAGSLTVNAGTLGGSGTISGPVTVASGVNVKPGNITPTSTAVDATGLNTGALSLAGGSTLFIEFTNASTYDKVVSSGALTTPGASLATPVMVDLRQENSVANFSALGTYTLIEHTGFSGDPDDLFEITPGSLQSGVNYDFNNTGTAITVTLTGTAPPEWNVNANGVWGDPGNWLNGVPNGSEVNAFLGPVISESRTVSVDAPATVGVLNFNSPFTYVVGGASPLSFENGAATAKINVLAGDHQITAPLTLSDPLDVLMIGSGDSLDIAGQLSGSVAVTKTSPGDLTLGANNSGTFTGTVSFSNGNLMIGTGSLGGNLTLDNAALVWKSGNTDDITTGRTITFGSNPVAFDTNGNDVTLAGDFGNAGTAAFTKAGAGKLTLGVNTTFPGNITISGGTLQLGTGGATGAVTALGMLNNGQLVVNRSADLILSCVITGTGGLAQDGPSILDLNAANTFSGNTTIAVGATIRLLNALGLSGSTLVYSATGGTLDFDTNFAATLGALSGDKNLALNNTSLGPVTLTVGGNNATTAYTGILSGDGSLTKTGTGVMTLSTAHSYLGATNVANGGGLTLNSGAVINGGAVNVTQSSNLIVNTGASLTASAASNVNNAGTFNPLLQVAGGSATFNGGLSALGNANNAYLIRVSGGTLNASTMTLGRSALTYGANIEPTAGVLNSGLVVLDGAVDIDGAFNVGTASTSVNSSVSSRIDGGSLNVDGVITVGLNSPDRWSALDVNGGTFTSTEATTGLVLGQTVKGSCAFLVRNGVATVERIQFGQGAVVQSSVTHVSGGTLYVGTGGMVLGSSEPGFVATLKLSGGILGAKGNWETTLPVITANTFEVKAADAANASFNIDLKGAVSGTGSLLKSGAGTLALTGTYTYSGSTEVDAGILQLDTATLSDTAPVDVSATGSGTIFLNHGSVDTVSAFRIDGVDQGSGTFTSITHPGRISGGGSLYVAPSDPFIGWASDRGLTGLDAAKTADPDKDGLDNLQEFAFDGNPTSGAASGKIRSRIETVGADQALVITMPVRSGAIFAGTPAKAATIDEVIYTIQGSNTLAAFDQVVSEIPESSAGMPSLSTGWSYRTFRLDGAIPARGATGFLRTDVADAAP